MIHLQTPPTGLPKSTAYHRRQRQAPEGGGGIMKEQIKAIRSIRAEISAIQKQTLEMIRLLEDQGILEPMQKPQTKKEKALKMGFAVIRGGALQ